MIEQLAKECLGYALEQAIKHCQNNIDNLKGLDISSMVNNLISDSCDTVAKTLKKEIGNQLERKLEDEGYQTIRDLCLSYVDD